MVQVNERIFFIEITSEFYFRHLTDFVSIKNNKLMIDWNEMLIVYTILPCSSADFVWKFEIKRTVKTRIDDKRVFDVRIVHLKITRQSVKIISICQCFKIGMFLCESIAC